MAEEITVAKLQDSPEDRFVRLRAELGVSSFGINQIVLQSGQRNRIHSHEVQEEVYLVLEGTLTLIVEGKAHEVAAGEAVRVGPNHRRQLVNRHRSAVSMVAMGGDTGHKHESRDGVVFLDWDGPSAGKPQDTPIPDDLPESDLLD